MKIIEFFKKLPWISYLISSTIVSIGALIIYSKDTAFFIFEEYLIWGVGVSWGLVFMFMIFFTLLLGKEN